MSATALPGTGPSLVYPPCPAPRLANPVNKDQLSICVCVHVCLGHLICAKIKINEKINLCRLESNVSISWTLKFKKY